MNKLLILTLSLFIFSMKINAYEYEIYFNHTDIQNGSRPRQVFYRGNDGLIYNYYYYYDSNNIIHESNLKLSVNQAFSQMGYIIKYGKVDNGTSFGYINKSRFIEYIKNDLNFLNDLYNQVTQPFLNLLYNDNMTNTSHILYEDYQILYNENGFAVESIVNGVWRGLYSSSEKSGYLYDKKGNLAYINGVEASFFEKLNEKLLKKFSFNLQSIFIRKIWYSLLVFIFAVVILRTVIRMAFQAFLIRFYDNKINRLEKRREKIENA